MAAAIPIPTFALVDSVLDPGSSGAKGLGGADDMGWVEEGVIESVDENADAV